MINTNCDHKKEMKDNKCSHIKQMNRPVLPDDDDDDAHVLE